MRGTFGFRFLFLRTFTITFLFEKWEENGWTNSKGVPVSNQDLIRKADSLRTEIENWGEVEFQYISREDNQEADELANLGCDEAY